MVFSRILNNLWGVRKLSFIALILSFLLLGNISLGESSDRSLSVESQQFVDAQVVAIVSRWDIQALRRSASEELLAAANHEIDLSAKFDRWSALGPMISYLGSQGKVQIVESDETGKMIMATFVAKAMFQNGSAEIHLDLVKRRGKWSIFSFDVEPHLTSPKNV